MNFDFLKNLFKKRPILPTGDDTLEDCVKKGLLSPLEMLYLKKERAVKKYEEYLKYEKSKVKK